MLSPTGKALTTRTAVRTAFLNCTTETRYNYQSEQYYRIKRKGEVQLHYHSTFDDDVLLYPNPEFERLQRVPVAFHHLQQRESGHLRLALGPLSSFYYHMIATTLPLPLVAPAPRHLKRARRAKLLSCHG
jgi:hypothetical protein